MSVCALVAAARTQLAAALFRDRCVVYRGADGWATQTMTACQLEETPPGTGGALDYETGAGYGATVFAPVTVGLQVGDRITVRGQTYEVQRVSPQGTNEPAQRAVCVRR